MEITEDELDFTSLSVHLSFLKREQIVDLIKSYYSTVPVGDIVANFGIFIDSAHLYQLFPPRILKNNCPTCSTPLRKDWKSRSGLKGDAWNKKNGFPVKENSYCIVCLTEKTPELKRVSIPFPKKRKTNYLKKFFIAKFISKNKEFSRYDSSLNFKEHLYLTTLLRSSLSEDGKYIKPLFDKFFQLSPTIEFSLEIISYLLERQIISLSPLSRESSCKLNGDNSETSSLSYFPAEVAYIINVIPETGDNDSMIRKLLNPSFEIKGNEEEYLAMWKKIATHECKQYMAHVMNRFGLEYFSTEKEAEVFLSFLEGSGDFGDEDFKYGLSVSQAYSVIHRGVEINYYKVWEGELTKTFAEKEALNTVEERWLLLFKNYRVAQNFNRPGSLPVSNISFILHTSFKRDPRDAFFEPPTSRALYNFRYY